MGNETLNQWHHSTVYMNRVGIDTAELNKDQNREHKKTHFGENTHLWMKGNWKRMFFSNITRCDFSKATVAAYLKHYRHQTSSYTFEFPINHTISLLQAGLVSVWTNVCVCMCVRQWRSVCVCVCEMFCWFARQWRSVCVCVCVCVWEMFCWFVCQRRSVCVCDLLWDGCVCPWASVWTPSDGRVELLSDLSSNVFLC